MRAWVLCLFVSASSFASPVAAQVINGESTYEDNYAHTPPATSEKAGKSDAGPSTDPDPAKTPPRDLHERDRD